MLLRAALCHAGDRRLCCREAVNGTLAVTGCRTGERALLDSAVEVLWAGPMRAHEAPRREPKLGPRLLCRGRLPRSVLDRRPIPQSGFPARRPFPNAHCHRQRGAHTLAVPAGGSAAGRHRPGAATQRWPRRSHQSSQRSIAPCWSPYSRATRHGRCRARAVLPEGGLIVCGDAWSRVGSSVGRRHTQPASTIVSPGKA